ncbi:MAG: hypothetical protein D6741_14880, partial [Planctomycetota bacterium]
MQTNHATQKCRLQSLDRRLAVTRLVRFLVAAVPLLAIVSATVPLSAEETTNNSEKVRIEVVAPAPPGEAEASDAPAELPTPETAETPAPAPLTEATQTAPPPATNIKG